MLSLLDVRNVVKAKPFAVLPGSGMSIEVTLKTGVKVQQCVYIHYGIKFQAFLGIYEVFSKLCLPFLLRHFKAMMPFFWPF